MAELISTPKDRNINFISSHVGGKNNDTQTQFKEQLNIINDNKKDFTKEYNNTETRFGNSNLNIDNFYFSNPIIYPETPDLYFEYIQKKNLKSINTQVITKLETFNVDSYFREKTDIIIIDFYESLAIQSLTFINNTNFFGITVNDSSKYKIDDSIILQGFTSYIIPYNTLNLFFENGSNLVTLDIKANFDIFIPLIDVYINITGIINQNVTNLNNYFKNIPLSIINKQQKILLTSENYLSFILPITFYTDNTTDSTLISSCKIEYLSIGNYPINLINANLPYSKYNLAPYQTIYDINENNLIIKLQSNISINNNIELNNSEWKNNKFVTGNSSIQIGRILNINTGFPNSSTFTYYLPKIIKNIVSVKMVSSEIPNTYNNIFLNINNTNNKFYWDIFIDNNLIPYFISLDYGFYDFIKLKYYIELKAGQVPRIFSDTLNKNNYANNIIKVIFNEELGTSTFSSYSKYILPQCLIKLTETNSTSLTDISSYRITIEQQTHNFSVGQRIYIENSLDYEVIPASYINNIDGYSIINIINNNQYQIQLDYVNTIVTNTNTISNGGFGITITTKNSFRLYFDKPDTFGDLIGFRNIGNSLAITPYSTIENNYDITNTQLYIYGGLAMDISNNLVLQTNILNLYRYKYILLTCKGLNNCISSNNISYFYKIELDNFRNNNSNKEIFYNSYVDNPIYFYPCLDQIENLEFKFIDPFGNEINFYNLDNSFTLVFTCIENFPENTNLNPKIART